MVSERIGRELRKIQRFREWGRGAFDAGRLEPAWHAGMAPHARMLKLVARCVLASLRGSTYKGSTPRLFARCGLAERPV